MFKKEKGITLVALVVTIIVLLILAGVTISLTVNQGGLFDRARTAGNTYRNSATNEGRQLNGFSDDIQNVMNEYDLN